MHHVLVGEGSEKETGLRIWASNLVSILKYEHGLKYKDFYSQSLEISHRYYVICGFAPAFTVTDVIPEWQSFCPR